MTHNLPETELPELPELPILTKKMNDFKDTVMNGRQLKAARAIVGMTIRELADAADIHHNTVTRIERLEVLPYNAVSADRMAKALQDRGIIFTAEEGIAGISFLIAEMRTRKTPVPFEELRRIHENSVSAPPIFNFTKTI